MNGNKNKIFNFKNCEHDQWYNLTIVQEEINEEKYKFTATVTELPEDGDSPLAKMTTKFKVKLIPSCSLTVLSSFKLTI